MWTFPLIVNIFIWSWSLLTLFIGWIWRWTRKRFLLLIHNLSFHNFSTLDLPDIILCWNLILVIEGGLNLHDLGLFSRHKLIHRRLAVEWYQLSLRFQLTRLEFRCLVRLLGVIARNIDPRAMVLGKLSLLHHSLREICLHWTWLFRREFSFINCWFMTIFDRRWGHYSWKYCRLIEIISRDFSFHFALQYLQITILLSLTNNGLRHFCPLFLYEITFNFDFVS